MARLGTGVQRLTLAAWMVLAAAGVIVLCAPEAVTPESYAVTRPADDEDGGEGDREAARAVLDPTEWGSDHVGEPLPMYVDSGECLFCHRNDIGATWSTNDRHSRTIRIIADDPEAHEALAEAFPKQAEEAELVLGLEPHVAFLKRAEAYGKMDLLSIGATRRPGRRVRLERGDEAHWQTHEFNENCAGCHTRRWLTRRSRSTVSVVTGTARWNMRTNRN